MANIGNQNIINDFKDAYIEDKTKQVLKSFPRDEQLSIVLLRRSAMQNNKFNDSEFELMSRYSTAVNEVESDYEENVSNKRKRAAEGFTKKQKNNKSKKNKTKKSKKQRKIKKKSKKTFRRF